MLKWMMTKVLALVKLMRMARKKSKREDPKMMFKGETINAIIVIKPTYHIQLSILI
jgi:hypothetical protein